MFAVQGWNISASLQTQTDVSSTVLASNSHENGAPPTKKRKRDHKKSNESSITGDNIADLWQKHFEGGNDGWNKAAKQKMKKKNKALAGNQSAEGSGTEPTEEAEQLQPVSNGNTTKTKKKRQKKNYAAKEVEDTIVKMRTPKVPKNGPAKSQTPSTTLTPLQASMRSKLAAARFRHLNEELYTKPSTESLALFSESPEMFDDYHTGFQQQVGVWPENPVDGYIKDVLERGRVKTLSQKARFKKEKKGQAPAPESNGEPSIGNARPLPRTQGTCTLADLGCGTAGLSTALQPHLSQFNSKIHSFDLAASSPLVTIADISNLPLPDGSVDIAIFCLALMGTNWIDFVEEAWRVLRWKGELWVAEIKSRFGRVEKGKKGVVEHSVGNRQRKGMPSKKRIAEQEEKANDEVLAVEVDEVDDRRSRLKTDVSTFVEILRKRGFVLDERAGNAVDLSNKMFVKMSFVKGASPVKGKNVPTRREDEGRVAWKSKRKLRFLDDAKHEEEEDETKALKPCVYKV
ncbi:hypothetical protein M501DRAFT_997299, partial [Patellaria atrata CBS 101060]